MPKSNNVKSIEFNLKNSIAYICSSSLTVMRLFMSTPPFLSLEWDKLSSQEKFAHLQHAFEGSSKDVKMPENPPEYSKSILNAFGFKSWSEFYEGGRHCSIDLDIEKKEYRISPMIYVKEQGSLFGTKTGDEIISSDATAEEVIAALEKVLNKIPQLTEDYYSNEDVSDD
jgi:hypothetical protein